MKSTLAIFLIFIIHLQPLYNASIWADFIVNNDYIKEVLCINRARPELKCGGKCYLMQRFEEQKREQEQQLPQLQATRYEFIIAGVYDFTMSSPLIQIDYQSIEHPQELYMGTTLFTVWHPPRQS